MSERFLILLIGAFALVLALLVFREHMPSNVRRALGEKPVVQKASAPAPVKPPAAPARRTGQTALKTGDDSAASREMPVREISVRIPASPGVADVLPAMSRAEVVQNFGPPDLSATWSDSGRLNEKLYYVDNNSALEIMVRDGFVVSSRAQE